jgi:lipopolysaccharide/colanic/teichoic acid biosynthesis glycosyltransferase
VNGRNALTWEQKFALDAWYIDHWTLLLDAKILAMTVARVLRREGISRSEAVATPEVTPHGRVSR